MTTPSAPAELAERALAAATDPCLVLVNTSSEANLRWAASTLTTNGHTSSSQVTVISVHGGDRAGVVSRAGVGPSDVAALVADAEAAARAAEPAEDAADLVTGSADDGFGEPPGEVSAADLASLTQRLGVAFESARNGAHELFGYAEQSVTTTYLATSTGIRVRHEQPVAMVQLNGKSHGRTRSAWVGGAAAALDAVDVPAMVAEVVQRLGWQARSVPLDAGRYDTVLPPSAVCDLMLYAYLSSDARSAHEGRSVFGKPGGGTRVGERLTPAPVTLRSDPRAPGLRTAPVVLTAASSNSASVFDNGLPIRPASWIDRGTLSALPTTRRTAELAGLPLTPPAENLLVDVDGGRGGALELVRDLEDGLLLTCLWYIREVDPQTLLLTGLTRDGVYRVQGGEVTGAVTNFRFNESPVGMLARVDGAGAPERALAREFGEYLPRTSAPAMLVRDFNFSSVSQAS